MVLSKVKNSFFSTLPPNVDNVDISELKKLMSEARDNFDQLFNQYFGGMFRNGLHSSFFAMQVGRYADLYTAKAWNLLEYSVATHNFAPPFQEIDNSGERLVSKHWRNSGTTVVNNNFVRLTPDRQSKKGALWSRKAVGVPSFSSILKFRISGQGKNFFGDGIAFWIIQQGYYSEGNLHGSEEKFTGIGIVFDTFKNTENIAAHRDVTILINDGTKTYEVMTSDVQGCNANFRYHADRADFSVTDASRAKVTLLDNSLEVYIDPQNSGEWTPCVNISNIGLPSNWARSAHIGLSASTGQLADNHDIISLKSYTDSVMLENVETEEMNKPYFALNVQQSLEGQLKSLEKSLNDLLQKHETLDHFVEHEFAAVADNIKNLIGKLEKREEKSESRLENLEALIKQAVDGTLDKRLSSLEMQMKGSVERKMNNIESSLDRKMNSIQDKTSTIVNSNSSSWKLPFLLLSLFVLCAGVGLYFFYRNLLKKHLL